MVIEVFFFNDTATTEIYTRSIVGSVRCVQETDSVLNRFHLIDIITKCSQHICHSYSLQRCYLHQPCVKNMRISIIFLKVSLELYFAKRNPTDPSEPSPLLRTSN
eukprot:TRINITY_DN11232_c0_g1_i4.p3 TRINITY_DN11232_c0_g1~~TRINITY_DN11232_c0_g1_i4.p3  ORF type:complete len:105 (+),score=14.47 TRINITY_DN11232_c0_g1_i4:45-359(+)